MSAQNKIEKNDAVMVKKLQVDSVNSLKVNLAIFFNEDKRFQALILSFKFDRLKIYL
jgi:hypothetical protein